MGYMRHTDIKTETFLGMVKKGLEQNFTGCTFHICSMAGNNGQKHMGITMQEPGRSTSPIICMEEEFQEFKAGRLFHDVLSGICRKFEDSGKADFTHDEFLDFAWAKNRIFFHLINAKKNRESLREMPHRRWMDLAVVYSLFAAQDGEWTASMPIRMGMMERWGVDEKTLYAYAQENTPRLFRGYCRPMGEVVSEMLGIPAPETPEGMTMHIAGNCRQYLGSAVVLYNRFLGSFADSAGGGFYILPSSIHEMIFLPASEDMDREGLLSMVREINRTQVSPEEVLSDNIYLYHADTGDVEMIEDASGSGYVSRKEKIVSGVF